MKGKILMACQNQSDKYHPHWGTFIEQSIKPIVKHDIELEPIICSHMYYQWYLIADILVLPSLPKRITTMIYETMSCELLVIANEDVQKNNGKNGRKRKIEQGWTWDNHAKKLIRIY